MKAKRFRVAVVRVPVGWRPTKWFDFPRSGEVVSVSVALTDRPYAEGCVCGFNVDAIRFNRREWAVILQPGEKPAVGQTCHRLVPMFAAG